MTSTSATLTATLTGSPGALAAILRSGGGTHRTAQKHKHSRGNRRQANAQIKAGRFDA